MNLETIISIIIFSIVPLIIYMIKYKKEYEKKEGNILTVASVIIGILICSISYITMNEKIDIISTVTGGIISILIANSLVFKKITIKAFFKFIFTIILFFTSSLFQIIPINLLGITISDNVASEINIFLTLFSDATLLFILIFMYFNTLKEDFKKLKDNFNYIFDTSFKFWLIGFFAMMASNILINLFVPSAVAGNENAVQSMIGTSPFVMLICAGFIAPIIEELTFRQAFRDIIKNKWVFILTSGIIFGLLHVVFAFESLIDFVYVLPYAALGISLAYMVEKTDNIYSSILMHCIHNSLIIIFSIMTGMIIL